MSSPDGAVRRAHVSRGRAAGLVRSREPGRVEWDGGGYVPVLRGRRRDASR
ncbi:hypothetical protein L810_2204 [Burkholderia sp. AU4i]|nr:hypothetical protein L810_2204 [Burkholderia sp. AU4i]QOH39111.1 hypothetical protein C7S14_0220 [Burkholderia cepacia]